MKIFLMYPDRDFDAEGPVPPNASDLSEDLGLSVLCDAMADGDSLVGNVARQALLRGLGDMDTIRYRQAVLQDALQHPSTVRDLYRVAVSAIEGEKKTYLGLFSHYPGAILMQSITVLERYLGLFAQLRQMAETHASHFCSQGFTRLFAMVHEELSEAYLAQVQSQLRELQFVSGVWASAELGQGLQGIHYRLHRKPESRRPRWIQRITGQPSAGYAFTVAERDESGARALSELKDRTMEKVAATLAESVDQILHFFTQLRVELAFYVGCLNLRDRLDAKGEPLCFPDPCPSDAHRHDFQGLYNVTLALTTKDQVVGTTAHADQKALIIITGANQGGKSTFLRSIGLAQLMMQCGMFVPAERFRANICGSLFTHFRREEDASLKHGKLDEELRRMSDIVDHLRPRSMVLFNESFAATNEREGSEIARQILSALLEKQMKVFFVTHLYELARGFFDHHLAPVVFLRAEREASGARTFNIRQGAPLPTSYGEDLYHKIFASDENASQPASP